ncbi:MAG: pyridoxine 5'-phosphate synthase [Deltaproteobacteria bacterium]|nr:pyridoxine 5'-phosphate synthase [Deltaproteobacteria bacterium]
MGIRLGVNIDHIATLREVRQAQYPDILEALFLCERGGADQITVHLREDRRHIQDHDVSRLLEHNQLPLNLEMAFVPEMVTKARKWRPYSVTLVPERRAEMTTESGLDLARVKKKIKLLQSLQRAVRVYGFIDASFKQVELAKELELDGIEFHTGPFAHAFEKSVRGKSDKELKKEIHKLFSAAKLATSLGLEVKAGHGLTVRNVGELLKMPGLSEMNIGHAIVARSVMIGLEASVIEMKSAILKTRSFSI